MASEGAMMQMNGQAMRQRYGVKIQAIINAWEEIVSLAEPEDPTRTRTTTTNLSASDIATKRLRMETMTQNIIRAAEDLMVLIRQMQETWLFGKLDTVGVTEQQRETDRLAVDVATLLDKFVKYQVEGVEGGKAGLDLEAGKT